MKMPIQKPRPEQGAVLVIMLIFAVVFGLTLGSYLLLASSEHRAVVRSQRWNTALTTAEAGVDEALAQMSASPSDFSANGWGTSSGSSLPAPLSGFLQGMSSKIYGPVTRTLANGVTYSVTIVGGMVPTIYATGYVPVPDTDQKVYRSVKVTTTIDQQSPFKVGLGARGNIDMNGYGMLTASWNSHSTNFSNNGLFDSSLTSTNGDVASEGGIVDIGNHTINGSLYLGPQATYVNGTNQVTGTVYYDYNVQFPDVTLPTTDTNGNTISWVPATSITKNGNALYEFTALNNNGYFKINSSTTPIEVDPGVSVTVQITASTFSPNYINLDGGTTNSGTLVLYQDAGSATLGGNSSGGAIGNRPENFIYFGLPDVTSISLSGTSTFIGAIYAPEAVLYLNGGGLSNNLEGSAIVKSVQVNGHYDFWYDESLSNYLGGPNRGYLPTSWQEL